MPKTREELAKLAAYQRTWRQKNLEKVRAAEAARFRNNPNKTRANREWNKRNRERMRTYNAKWEQNNPEQVRAANATKRARRRGAHGGGITAAERRAILADALGLCAYCNERRPLAIDHIEPLVRGGAHDVSNATAACKPCNSSKRDTPLLIWLVLTRAAEVP